MASNKLATTLEQEKLTSKQLAANCHLAKSTVKSVVLNKRTPAPATQEVLVQTLNRLTKKSFSVTEIFPVKKGR